MTSVDEPHLGARRHLAVGSGDRAGKAVLYPDLTPPAGNDELVVVSQPVGVTSNGLGARKIGAKGSYYLDSLPLWHGYPGDPD